MQYLFVKYAHMTFVAITILLFNLRFWLRTARPNKPLNTVLKSLPHLNDTMILFTALWLVKLTHFIPFGNANWLGVKILLLLAYIGLGMITFRAEPRSIKASIGYVASMACVACIVYLAYFKPF